MKCKQNQLISAHKLYKNCIFITLTYSNTKQIYRNIFKVNNFFPQMNMLYFKKTVLTVPFY